MTEELSNPWNSRIAASLYDRMHSSQDDVELFVSLAREAGGPILEIACGTGRCLIPIIRDGFDTVGIDASEPMLERLRRKLADEPDTVGHRATPIQGDGRTFMLPLRFGMAFIAANSFTHFLTKHDQERLAENVFQHLRPGGLFAVDVFNPSFDRLSRRESKRTQVGKYLVIQEERSVDYPTQIIEMSTCFHVGDECRLRVEWPIRYFFRYELEHLLEKTGFEILRLWGDHARHEFGEATDRLFIVARKPPDADMTVVQLMRAEVALSL